MESCRRWQERIHGEPFCTKDTKEKTPNRKKKPWPKKQTNKTTKIPPPLKQRSVEVVTILSLRLDKSRTHEHKTCLFDSNCDLDDWITGLSMLAVKLDWVAAWWEIRKTLSPAGVGNGSRFFVGLLPKVAVHISNSAFSWVSEWVVCLDDVRSSGSLSLCFPNESWPCLPLI